MRRTGKFLLLAFGLLGAAAGRAVAMPAPLCVYHDRSYTAGAHLCIQKHLMMKCMAEGDTVVWAVVWEQALSRLCSVPVAPGQAVRVPGRRAPSGLQRRPEPPKPKGAEALGRCFSFDGRRFCE